MANHFYCACSRCVETSSISTCSWESMPSEIFKNVLNDDGVTIFTDKKDNPALARSIRTLLKEGVRQDNITVLTLDDTQGFDEPSFKSYLMEESGLSSYPFVYAKDACIGSIEALALDGQLKEVLECHGILQKHDNFMKLLQYELSRHCNRFC